MRFEVLGPLRLERDGAPVALTSGKQRALLASLLIAAGETVSSDRLIQDVWGDDALTDARNTLQHGVAQLRKVLEPGRGRSDSPTLLISSGSGYRVALAEHGVDAAEFEAGVEEARALLETARPEPAALALDAALALWRGQAYEDFSYAGFARSEQERLAELRVNARELAVDARQAVQGPDAVISDLESLVVEHPYREGLRARLMKALYQAGRQAEALQVYRDAAAVLSDELGIAPSPELRELEAQILQQDSSLAQPRVAEPLHNLPAPTSSLVGRERDLEGVLGFLRSNRLVTLLGPGGSGKTRLALAAAEQVVEEHPDGVWLVRFDDLNDRSLIAATVGAVVGMPEAPERQVVDTLGSFLEGKRLLLILDNCEHLIEPVAELADRLVRDCPDLVILATSQEALGVSGEQRVQVPPLALPEQTASPFDEIESSSAVELYFARAAAMDPDVDRSTAALNAVANIVRALDGIPLAIELAAARSDLLTPVEIARRLGDRFQLLDAGPRDAPERQRTLRDAVSWSYGLLDPTEQGLFVRLGVFTGGFDVSAVVAVAESTEEEAFALVARLVRRSLVAREATPDGTSRFRLLETLRQFGLQELAERGLSEHVRALHASHYAALARQLDLELMGAKQIDAFATFIADADNMRAAMEWSLNADQLAPGIEIAARSGRFWDWRGSLAEAHTWLGRFTEAAGERTFPNLAFMMTWTSFFTAELGDLREAQRLNADARRVAEAQDDRYAVALAMAGAAMYARIGGDPAEAVRIDSEIRRIGLESGQNWVAAWSDSHDALAMLATGDLVGAQDAADASLRRFREEGDDRATGWVLSALAQTAHARGDHGAAIELAREAADLSLRLGDGRNAATASQVAAEAARATGDEAEARRLDDEAATLLVARGMPFSPWRRTKLAADAGRRDERV